MKDLALVAGIILLLFMAGLARDHKEDRLMTWPSELVGDWVCTQKGAKTNLQLEPKRRATMDGKSWFWGINRLDQFCMAPLDECNTYPFICIAYDLEDGKLFLTPKSFPCTRFEKIPTKTSEEQPGG